MKKAFVLILMMLLLFSAACQPAKGVETVKNTDSSQVGDQTNRDDVEDNINLVDIQDDVNLTEKAEKKEQTEQDVLVDQNTIELNKDKLERGEVILISDCEEDSTADDQCSLVEVPVLKSFSSDLPEGLEKQLAYEQYPVSYDYLLVDGSNINIRTAPRTSAPVVAKASIFEKLNVLQQVQGEYLAKYKSDHWYRVFWNEGGKVKYGFVFGYLVTPRRFQFEKMTEAVNSLQQEIGREQIAYIANYKNRSGIPPLYHGQAYDPYGNARDQSAAGYYNLQDKSEFRYFPDGMLVSVLGEEGNFYRVKTLSFPGEYWIDKKYLSFRNSLKELTKVVVVDRNYQNEGVFEYREGGWKLISYTFATTGVKGKYSFETPLGYYMAIETRDRFLYLKDGTQEIAGYAPYAIRFSAGGYIHGVPVDYKFVDGKRVDPGMREYLYTIGSTPRSHKCVRNYTSHAKFLYDWIEIGKSAVIVIEH